MFNLGIKHIPQPKDLSDSELNQSFERFRNKTLWNYHFESIRVGDLEPTITDHYVPKLKPPRIDTKRCSFVRKDHLLHQSMCDLSKELLLYANRNPTSLTPSSTIRDVSILKDKYKEIVFRPADKNLGLCAIHISHYNELVMAHLGNTSNYELVADTPRLERLLLIRLNTLYDSFILNTDWFEEERPLIKFKYSFTLPKFHVMPKLHKEGPVKGRPIAGMTNWITTPISRILDHRLLKQLHLYPNILKNSLQLVKELEFGNNINAFAAHDCYLITADIESLYPNIDIAKLSEIIESIDPTCTALTDFVCANSYVKYNDQVFKQLNGIPMGTNAAVSLANMYVGQIIDRFIDSRPQVIQYRRYIDDLFIIWKGSLDVWERAKTAIQRILKIPINFDAPSKDKCIFLDLEIRFNPYTKNLDTFIYQKPLNKYNYISPHSCHAPPMFSGFIKGELTRYARLCSNIFGYQDVKKKFYQRLIQRGYQRKFLNPIFHRHHWSERLKERDSSGPKILAFVLPFTLRKNASSINKIVKKYSMPIQSYFTYSKVLLAYQRRRNIGDLLCPSEISKDQQELLKTRNFLFGQKKL